MISELKTWINGRQDWQQKILEDLLKGVSIDEQYIIDTVSYMKTSGGQAITTNRDFSRLGAIAGGNSGLSRLNYIKNVKGVNRLKDDVKLEFNKDNLTVVYGDNGSGKSSYVRLLKKICNKRYAQEIKQNIYVETPVKQECVVGISIKGTEEEHQVDIANCDEIALQDVKIYDSHMGSEYLRSDKPPTYMPGLIVLLEDLVQIIDKVGRMLKDEGGRLISCKPAMPTEYSTTPQYIWYGSLSDKTSESDVNINTTWTDNDAKQLIELLEKKSKEELQEDILGYQAKMKQLKEIIVSIETAVESLNEQGVSALCALHADLHAKKDAVQKGISVLSGAVLDGVGEETWKSLWEAARKFSQERVYIEQPFPYVGVDARCVLCHQVLNTEASARLQSFEKYVTNELSQNAEIAAKAYQDTIIKIPRNNDSAVITTKLNAAGITQQTVIERTIKFWSLIEKIIDKIEKSDYENDLNIDMAGSLIIDDLKELLKVLEEEEKKKTELLTLDTMKQEESKLSFKAREWLSKQKDQVNAEIALKKRIKSNDQFNKNANTRDISTKVRELTEKLVTKAYIKRFTDEIGAIADLDFSIELNYSGIQKAAPMFNIKLPDAKGNMKNVTEILSEGEIRITELASFLADMKGSSGYGPFIFDDPISSLDDCYQRNVVRRLKQIAKERQVIVFTHRLSLVNDLLGHDRVKNAVFLAKLGKHAGVVGEIPFRLADPLSKLNLINNEKIPQAANKEGLALPGAVDFDKMNICKMIRLSIESIVERVLINGIVLRHSREIHLKGKVHSLHLVSREDCDLIDDLVSSYSYYEHDQPDESPGCLPSLERMKNDVAALIGMVNKYKGLQNNLGK